MIFKNYTFHVKYLSLSDVSSCVFSATSIVIATSCSVFLILTWTCFLIVPCPEICPASSSPCRYRKILRIVSAADSFCHDHAILISMTTHSGIVSVSSSCSSPYPDHFWRISLTSEVIPQPPPPVSLPPSDAASSCSAPPAQRSSSRP